MKRALRVAWLCTFSNPEKQSHLKFWRKRGGEVGQWIPNLLQAFKNDAQYELHVITFDCWMKARYATWKSEGITYHCFQPPFPWIGYNARIPIEQWTDFIFNRRRVNKLIRRIRPDIVHLYGAENPRYATAVLDVPVDLPVLCTIQGFATRELPHKNTYVNRVRSKFEKRIMKHLQYFIGDYDSKKVVKSLNPNAFYDPFYFPVNEALVRATAEQEMRYDVLFAGGLTKAKGFGDFLKIVAECASRRPGFKAAVVGRMSAYLGADEFVKEKHLEDVITWMGRFPTQEGLFIAYRQSKLFLAPTYNDAFASTIRENMLLGTPCIAYETGGIPYANDDGNENVVIVPQGNWKAMAEKVLDLTAHEDARQELAARAKRYAEKTFSLEANVAVIKKMYERLVK